MQANHFHRTVAGLILLLGVAACGDNDELVCAPGTFKDGANCVLGDPKDKTAPITTADPGGATTRVRVHYVRLTTDEPATIHVTTDGSEPDPAGSGEPSPVVVPLTGDSTTIKFFAVDAAGNTEATHTETYAVDEVGPAPVSNLAVTTSGSTATVTWVNPTDADYAGTLVARVDDLLDFRPDEGKIYAATDTLTSSVKLVVASAATQVTDPGRPVGPARYVAWAYDSAGNYSLPRVVETQVGTVERAATFTFDTSTDTLTQTGVPASFDFSATTAERNGSTVTLHLSVKNQTAHHFQNPKIRVTSVTNATFGSSDGTTGGSPFAKLGLAFLAPGATRTKDLTFTGANGSTLVTIQLDVASNGSIVGGNRPRRQGGNNDRHIIDFESGLSTQALTSTLGGQYGSTGGMAHGAMLTAHRFLDLTGSHGVERWDMSTLTRTGGVFGPHVLSMLSDGANRYALVTRTKRMGASRLVRLTEALLPDREIDLEGHTDPGFSMAALSADGTTIATSADEQLQLVDTRTFSLIDLDPSTSRAEPIDPGIGRLRAVTFFNGTNGLVVIARTGSFAVIKRSSTGYSVKTYGFSGKGSAVLTAPDGRVWIATLSSLQIYDPTTDTVTAASSAGGAMAMTLVDGQLWVLRPNRVTLEQLDSAGAIQKTLSVSDTGYGHWISATQ